MHPATWLGHVDVALRILPPRLTSDEARAMLVAIALQESDLVSRQQIGGPALSYLMWEPGPKSGLPGVLRHHATGSMAARLVSELDYSALEPEELRQTCVTDGVLSAGLGRLLLFTLPYPLPPRHDVEAAYRQYIDAWRPGKRTPGRWAERYRRAWDTL